MVFKKETSILINIIVADTSLALDFFFFFNKQQNFGHYKEKNNTVNEILTHLKDH